jgi:hypothetical protein
MVSPELTKIALKSQSLWCLSTLNSHHRVGGPPGHGVPAALKIAHQERLVGATGNKRYVPLFIPECQ